MPNVTIPYGGKYQAVLMPGVDGQDDHFDASVSGLPSFASFNEASWSIIANAGEADEGTYVITVVLQEKSTPEKFTSTFSFYLLIVSPEELI